MMKLTNSFSRLTRNLVSGAAMITIVANMSILTGCSKEEHVQPENSTKPSSARGAGQGTDHGYFWTLWSAGTGTSDISFPYADTYAGNFEISYTNDGCVGGKGWATGTDTRVVNYNIGYLTASNTYNTIGVYGWTQTPLIEYYVNEAGFTPYAMGTQGVDYDLLGPVVVDGHTYQFARHKQTNKPSIEAASSTFWQYIDNWGGQTFNGSKKVSMSGHVANWKKYGGKGWGKTHNYQVFAIEAYGGKTGKINATVW
jgi:endo-1,4-beta-xylanase